MSSVGSSVITTSDSGRLSSLPIDIVVGILVVVLVIVGVLGAPILFEMVSSEDPDDEIHGTVLNNEGEPVSDVLVEL